MTKKLSPGLFAGRSALKSLSAYAIGILAATFMPASSMLAILLAAVLAIIGLIYHLRQNQIVSTVFLLLALMAAGVAQYKIAVSDFPPTHVKHIAETGNSVTAVGEISAEPDIRSDRTYLIIDIDSLTWRKRDFESCGKIMLKIKQPAAVFSFRDRVKVKGSLFKPGGAHNPGGFDFARWLSNKEVFGMIVVADAEQIEILPPANPQWWGIMDLEKTFINKLVSPLRSILLNGYDKYLSPDQASLLAGFVLGEKRDMPDDIVKLFRDTGTLHLMAVSGSNVAIIVSFFLAITFWINRRLRILIVLCAVIFFSFLTKNEPSVVRASVMAAVGLLGFYRQKNPDIMGLLGFSGLILLIMNPLWIFNVGFQLSFAACFGIVYLMPIFLSQIKKRKSLWIKISYWVLFTFLATISAQIAVLPLTAEYFNRLPIIGVLANIPMIGLASVLTVAGVSFLPFLILGDTFAIIFAWPLSKIMSIIIPMLRYFVNLPYSVVNVHSPGWIKIILFYTCFYLILELISRKRLSFKALTVALMSIAVLVCIDYLKGGHTESLTFIDCDIDRAVIYRSPEGSSYLWYDCHERGHCTQIEKSLLPYFLKADVYHIDTIFTEDIEKVRIIESEIRVSDIVQHSNIKFDKNVKIEEAAPYPVAESILNKRVKFVGIETDNNIETLIDGRYYRLSTTGGDCILAGSIDPRFACNVNRGAKIVELPWSAQPYGKVFRSLKEFPPDMLVFSPDRNKAAAIGERDRLTYFNERTWSVAFAGNFRIRFSENRMHVDYMLKP